MTTSPKVMATPTWVTPPLVRLSMMIAPVPQKTRAKVPIISAMDFWIIWFFGVDGDAVDAGAGQAEGGNFFGTEVWAEHVIGEVDGLILLDNDVLKAIHGDELEVVFLLNSAGDAT